MSDNVVGMFGATLHTREVRASAVMVLEEALEKARSGEVQGVVIAMLHHDRLSSYAMGGVIQGSYSLIGALDIAHAGLVRYAAEQAE